MASTVAPPSTRLSPNQPAARQRASHARDPSTVCSASATPSSARAAATSSTRTAGISAIVAETPTATSSSNASPARALASTWKDCTNSAPRPR